MKTAIVTGAGGALGKVVTRLLLESGYHVYAIDLKIGGLEDMESATLKAIEVDITNAEEIENIFSKLNLDETGLDVLVSLAGIYDTFPVTEGRPEKFKRIMEVNFIATAQLVSGLFKPLVRNKGRVIVISSESYKIQAMFQPYMISKAALEAYCHAAWQELALVGVRLSVVRPGAFKTPLLDWMNWNDIDDPESIFREEFNRSLDQSRKMVGTITSPEKVAEKVMQAVLAKKPKKVYLVNNNPVLSIISLLPDNWIDYLIVKNYKKK
jgi:NAD(P)-dependent dehydrogenase (short-subunit alcohol dehydrogenase family)